MIEKTINVAELLMELKKRTDMHWARKVWHMAGVSFMAVTYTMVSDKWAAILIGLCWLAFIPVDIARQYNPKLNRTLVGMFQIIMRQSEVNKLAGTSFLITGVALIILVFPRDIVTLTLLFLAFADPVASFFGIRFGKDKILGNKSLQGTLAAFFVCSFLTYAFLFYHVMYLDRIIIISLLAGVAGSLAELIPVWKLDDNFTLPVVSASALWILFSVFGS